MSTHTEITGTCYSTGGEDFDCQDRGELFDRLDSDGEMGIGRTYWEADYCALSASDFDHCTEGLLESLDEALYEVVGESADNDFTDCGDDAKKALNDMIRNWITEHVRVGRYWKIVGKPRELTVSAADVVEYFS